MPKKNGNMVWILIPSELRWELKVQSALRRVPMYKVNEELLADAAATKMEAPAEPEEK